MNTDILVVGAGPAGSLAAYHLAKAGRDVLVCEGKRWPRYKTCGGGVVARARALVPHDAKIRWESECHQATLAAYGRSHAVRRLVPLVSMVMRSHFDAALLDAARTVGAEFRDESPVTTLQRERYGWRVTTQGREVRCRFIVAADGAHSQIAKCLGWPALSGGVPALESEITVEPRVWERFADNAWFELVPGGYAWVFPKAKPHLSVGILTMHKVKSLKTGLRHFLEAHDIVALEEHHHGFVVPLRPRASSLAQDGVFLVGDAAGLADPITAEGISHAMLSGTLAAQALALSHPETAYQRQVQHDILRPLASARRLARLFYGPAWRQRLLLRLGGKLFTHGMARIIEGELNYTGLVADARVYAALGKSVKKTIGRAA